jgi:hypothetical protein
MATLLRIPLARLNARQAYRLHYRYAAAPVVNGAVAFRSASGSGNVRRKQIDPAAIPGGLRRTLPYDLGAETNIEFGAGLRFTKRLPLGPGYWRSKEWHDRSASQEAARA